MIWSNPILTTGITVAIAAFLTLRRVVVASNRQSMVKVRSRQRHPANTKIQG